MKEMKKTILYMVWLILYILCVGLGTLESRSTAGQVILTVLAVVFFVPGALLLVHGYQTGERKLLVQIRLISLISLVLTLSLIVLNILLVRASSGVGETLNDILILVSAPMFCSYWHGVSLFLWAGLFVSSFPKMFGKHMKKGK